MLKQIIQAGMPVVFVATVMETPSYHFKCISLKDEETALQCPEKVIVRCRTSVSICSGTNHLRSSV